MSKEKQMSNMPEERIIKLDGKLEIRSDQEGEERVLSGYAAVFEQWANVSWWFKEKIARGAFDNCVFDNCIAAFNHDVNTIMARYSSGTLKLEQDEKGLHFEFSIPNTTNGNDLYELVKRGDITQCSFKFTVEKEEWRYSENNTALDERIITAISELYDISPVVYPAYEGTSVDARSLDEMKKKKQAWIDSRNNDKDDIEIKSKSRDRAVRLLSLGN